MKAKNKQIAPIKNTEKLPLWNLSDLYKSIKSRELNNDLDFIKRFEGQGGRGLNESEVHDILSSKGFENFEFIPFIFRQIGTPSFFVLFNRIL